MNKGHRSTFGAALLAMALLLTAACQKPIPSSSPAPVMAGSGGHAHGSEHIPDRPRVGYTAGDVRFMHHMIHHHAQALTMTALVAERASHPQLRLLAERMEVSQQSEVESMQHWLRVRGEHVPDLSPTHEHSMGGSMSMPGMLTPTQLVELRIARGPAFDRLFLSRMIEHHEGALAMVAELFATPGAAQGSELYRFATDVDSEQRAEIARMRAILNTLP